MRSAIGASELKRNSGREPCRDHARLLRDTVEWYQKNKWWWSGTLSGSYRLERQGLEFRGIRNLLG